jgi:hypothetical protein
VYDDNISQDSKQIKSMNYKNLKEISVNVSLLNHQNPRGNYDSTLKELSINNKLEKPQRNKSTNLDDESLKFNVKNE